MNIEKMHIVFREFAQKFGMQNVRAILDEDIDICINTAIINLVREILIGGSNQTSYADKLIRQNVSIAPINALRTLYSKCIVDSSKITLETDTNGSENNNNNNNNGEIENSANVKEPASEINPYIIDINDCNLQEVLIFTGFKVSYKNDAIYDCRIIELEDLGSSFRDYCNRPTYDYPIVSLINYSDKHVIELYTGNNSIKNNKTNFKKPDKVQIIYIRKPAEVKYDKNNLTNCVDCELPSYLHEEVIINAAKIYLESITTNNQNYNNQQTNR